jgi:hypothetical protein
MQKNYRIDVDNMITSENGLVEYVTVFDCNNVPKWHKIKHNNNGAYILYKSKRIYVLVNSK